MPNTSPKPLPEVKPYKPGPDYKVGMKSSDVRKNAPFQVGDIIYVERYLKVKGKYKHVAKIAKVIHVHTNVMERIFDIVPVYRVAMLRPDGTFHENPRKTLKMWPGDVYRGYCLMNANNGY